MKYIKDVRGSVYNIENIDEIEHTSSNTIAVELKQDHRITVARNVKPEDSEFYIMAFLTVINALQAYDGTDVHTSAAHTAVETAALADITDVYGVEAEADDTTSSDPTKGEEGTVVAAVEGAGDGQTDPSTPSTGEDTKDPATEEAVDPVEVVKTFVKEIVDKVVF